MQVEAIRNTLDAFPLKFLGTHLGHYLGISSGVMRCLRLSHGS